MLAEVCANVEPTIWPKIAACYKKVPNGFQHFYVLNCQQFSPGILSEFKASDGSLASLGLCFSSVYICVSVWGGFAVMPWLSPFVGHWSSCRTAPMLTCSFQRRASGEFSPKASQGLVEHTALIQGAATPPQSPSGCLSTLLCKRKDVKLPRAPTPAWRGACTLERVICFMWHPFAGDWQLLKCYSSSFHQDFWLIILFV